MTPLALAPLIDELSKILRGAIFLVKLMGERYIWTGRLCLV